jgi:hypothetical protein
VPLVPGSGFKVDPVAEERILESPYRRFGGRKHNFHAAGCHYEIPASP